MIIITKAYYLREDVPFDELIKRGFADNLGNLIRFVPDSDIYVVCYKGNRVVMENQFIKCKTLKPDNFKDILDLCEKRPYTYALIAFTTPKKEKERLESKVDAIQAKLDAKWYTKHNKEAK